MYSSLSSSQDAGHGSLKEAHPRVCIGFRVQGLWFRDQGLGIRV